MLMRATETLSGAAITILLSTYNGEKFLREQLASFKAQSFSDWRLLWRDDGSTDNTVAIMREFAAGLDAAGVGGRCVESAGSGPHFGATNSFLRLLAEASDEPIVAFADQDDVWLPDKLQRTVAQINTAGATPALYCAKQFLVNEQLRGHRLSAPHSNPPGFPACLTQNIANGNTLALNRAAAALVSSIPSPEGTIHDWWSYIVVSACGGKIFFDPQPQVLYRLHKRNLIGRARPMPGRALAAMRRGPGIFMTMMRRHANSLAESSHQLSPAARADLALVQSGLKGSIAGRVGALRCPRFRRRSALENLLFRYWFITG
jgi:glycosyltransferase involved in cell wall biosynthesis